MDVRMPDGTIITNVPDNITQEDLLSRYSNFSSGAATSTKNPLMGLVGRAAGLTASGVEAVAEVAERTGDYLESKIPLSNIPQEQIKSQKQLQPLFDLAGSLRNAEKNIGYNPSTKLSELADNPLNAVPFIAERIITSTPDMAAAVFAFVPYVSARTKEILDERVKNDNKTLDDATVGDVASATGAAIAEATIERFATKRLGKGAQAETKTGRLAKETGIQGGTEAVEEGAAYLGETAGTVKGVDPKELGERMLEGAIVGGGLGGGVQATREVIGGKEEKVSPQKEEELKSLAQESAPERIAREQTIEQQEPTFAPEEAALEAFKPTEVAAEAAKPIVEEAPEAPLETKIPEREAEPPRPAEIVDLERQAEETAKELRRAETKERGPSLATILKNRLSESDAVDITPEPGLAKYFRMSPKRGPGEQIGNIVRTGELDDFLRPEMVILSTDDAAISGDKQAAAEEYIKEKLRSQNYLTFDTEMRLEQLGYNLKQIEQALDQELTDEQIRQEANAIAAELAAEEGLSRPEAAPEEGAARGTTERITEPGKPEEGVGFLDITPKEDRNRFEIRKKSAYRGRTTADVDYGLYRDGKLLQTYVRKKDAQQALDIYTLPDEEIYIKYPELKPSEADITARKRLEESERQKRLAAVERPELELKAETAEETVARQEQDEAQREERELKKIADLERDLFKLEQESNPATPPIQQKLFDVTSGSPAPIVNEAVITPSFTRAFDRSSKLLDQGKITPDQFATMVQDARREAIEARQAKPIQDRVRGMNFIIERLRNGLRHEGLTEETVELTEWFMKQNPRLVDDLGISIRSSDEKGTSGQYFPTSRVAKLIAGSEKTDTAVHEILHHLERMMPEKIRNDIVKSWARQYADAKKAAKETGDKSLIDFFGLLDQHHNSGKVEPFNKALDLIKNGNVDYVNYQFVNPSEFWAVNASKIIQGRFDVRGDRLGSLKKWLFDLVQKIKDIFKLKSDAPIIRALNSLAKADGKFVSTEMLAGTGIYPNVRTNIFGNPPPNAAWGRPDDSKVDDVVVVLQDKMIDTKKVIQKIEEAQGKLKDRWDAYLQEELYHGRTAKQTNDFLQQELSPLLKEIQSKGFTIADVEEYLHNRHAEERNIQVAKVNPNMPDGGSGIMTADAKAYLASLSPTKKQDLESIAKKVDAITLKTRQTLIQNGVEEPNTIAAWEGAYKNYVPLNREENDYELSNIGRGIGQGFSVRGPSSKRAAGSTRQVVDILANIAMQRERAIVRSEKTRVGQAVYGLAVQHPNTDFWLAIDPLAIKDPAATMIDLLNMGINPADAQNIISEPTRTYVDPKTGTVTQRINPALRGAENVLAVRVNGKDKFVFFNTKDPRAIRMAHALKNLDADQLSKVMSIAARITRYFAAVNTQYNPIFGLWNFSRDVLGSTLNLTTTPIHDKTKQVIADTFPALGGIYADLRARRAGKNPPTTGWAKLWDEFQKEGGQTGFRDQFSRTEERTEALQRELGRLTEGKPMKSARAIFDWLSDYNETMENAVRLSAYKAALDKGLSKERAASVAKNLTVNFNRKGQIARQANALYAFFNASVQGTARMWQTLKGPAGKTIMAGGLGLGIAQAMTLMAFGFDEDEPPDFIKERNIVIPIGGKKYVTIPMPLGFNIIPNTSRIMTEWAMSGFKDTSKRVAQILGATLEMFNPIGNAGWSFQTFAPTIADPAVALFENKDWTGKPIAKEDISSLDPTPGYTRAKDAASWFSKNLAEFLNYATGGTKYRPGVFSPTPDQIDYLIGQITGGVGREVLKVEQTARAAVTGEELPSYKIPLFGRLFGSAEEQSAQRDKFYNNIKLLNEHENEIKGRRKAGEPVEDYVRENPESRLFGAANGVEKVINNLVKRREDLIKKGAPKNEVKEIEKRITEAMVRFNERVAKAKESK